jgi:hypothetical protein
MHAFITGYSDVITTLQIVIIKGKLKRQGRGDECVSSLIGWRGLKL